MARRLRIKGEQLRDAIKFTAKQIGSKKGTTAHNLFWGAFAHSLFTSIYTAFKEKSDHGIDNLGEVWADLTPEYKAYKIPMGAETPTKYRRRNNLKTIGLLSSREQKRWSKEFGKVYHRTKKKLGEKEAKALAGAVAWKILKEMGAPTKIELLGNRKLPIHMRTKRLYNSLKPGRYGKRLGYAKSNDDQVFKQTAKTLQLGTKVPYAKHVDSLRPLWSYDIDPWIDKALNDAIRVLSKELPNILERNAK
jgi:hypothetical protein